MAKPSVSPLATDACTLLLDQGSHACRALIADTHGRLLGRCLVPVGTHADGVRVEQSPDEIIAALQQAISGALAESGVHASRLVAAALATQRSSIACWRRSDGVALGPMLSWQDRRAADWLAALAPDPDTLRRITGLVPSAHYGASKLRWCLDHLPEVRAAQGQGNLCMGPIASFLLARLLVGYPCKVDPANAARTMLWDLQRGDWSAPLLAQFGIPQTALPTTVPSRHLFGTLPLAGASVPLTVCTGDQSAALFAHGWPRPDSCYMNLGTGAFVQRPANTAPTSPPPGILTSVTWQDESGRLDVLEGTVNGAGAALDWLACSRDTETAQLIAHAETWLQHERAPPLFINGVGGLGAPYWAPNCPVLFEGDAEDGRTVASIAACTVAVLESIVFLLLENMDTMTRALGPADRVVVSGGLSRLDGLCQRLADLSGLPVV
ncbi:MAG: hypothetical protein JJT93_15965, partial [Gammaproteobacteria bacterium]|nr:hypothetical protein [Gammaproteobacteria bacterium]